jgi:peptidoglycan/LPS O-acetylase OafA/YrhL
VQLPGVNLVRTIGVLAVLYTHISYYFIDGMGTGWWLIDVVYQVFVRGLELNQHLTFFGVVLFMMLTGALITGSAIKHRPGVFLFHRIGRLVPMLWVAVAAAIILVRLHVNGMFSGGPGIGNVEAAWSFVLGGFFHKPEFAVLGVTWTLVVQLAFYMLCVACRPVLRTKPGLVPIIGSALCAAAVLYIHFAPSADTIQIAGKVAATLPAALVGQVFYLGWAKLVSWRWVVAGLSAPLAVVTLASTLHAYWGGTNHYLWTAIVGAVIVLALARRDNRVTRSKFVYWVGTRSYPIYLVHTLILYKIYQLTVGPLGKTGAIVAFVLVTCTVAEICYRFVEVPAGRWISQRVSAHLKKSDARAAARAENGERRARFGRLGRLLRLRGSRVPSKDETPAASGVLGSSATEEVVTGRAG